MDTTFRGWSSTLAARVRLVISRLVLIFALLLDFHGKGSNCPVHVFSWLLFMGLRPLASDSLRKLQSSIHRGCEGGSNRPG